MIYNEVLFHLQNIFLVDETVTKECVMSRCSHIFFTNSNYKFIYSPHTQFVCCVTQLNVSHLITSYKITFHLKTNLHVY